MFLKRFLAAVAAVAVTAGMASAATLTVTGVTGTWTSASPGRVAGLQGVGTADIKWGNPASQAGKSGYSFDELGVGTEVDAGTVFDIGQFTHLNNPIRTPRRGAGSITQASLSIGTTVQYQHGGQLVSRTITSTFDFLHTETNNNPGRRRSCANGQANGSGVNVNGCADLVRLVRNDSLSETILINGVTYVLDIVGFLFNGEMLTDFWTVERQDNSAILQATLRRIGGDPIDPVDPVDPAPVPLPAAGFLLLGGLGGLAVARRARRA